MYVFISIITCLTLLLALDFSLKTRPEIRDNAKGGLYLHNQNNLYTTIYVWKSFGGKKADCCLTNFPSDKISFIVAKQLNGNYMLRCEGVCELTLNSYPCQPGTLYALKNNDIIEVLPEDGGNPWAFDFRRRT